MKTGSPALFDALENTPVGMIDSIGQQLRKARQERGLTLEQAAKGTHLRLHNLQALEAGNFDAIPSLAQVRGFLRIYADYLGLDSATLLQSLKGQEPAVKEITSPRSADESQPPAADNTAADIFREIGQKLKSQRELLGLSIEDVAHHTHLRSSFLLAMESGNFGSLPSPVQGRGMLSNYAEFLGGNPDALLLRYAEALQAQLAARQASQPVEKPAPEARSPQRPAWARRFFSSEMLLVSGAVIILVTFLVWAAIRVFTLSTQQQPSPTAPSISNILLSAPTETPRPTPLAPTATIPSVPLATPTLPAAIIPGATPGPGEDALVRVYLTIRQRTWIRVTVDGKVAFEGRVVPGNAYQYTGDESVAVLTGNGAAIQIFFNQQDLGPLGAFGEVVERVFTPAGIQTPTPTISPSPSPTLPPTRPAGQITNTPPSP